MVLKCRVIVFLTIIVSCVAAFLTSGVTNAQEIHIGVLLPLNGKLALVGDMERKAFEMAKEEAENSPILGDRKLVFDIRDTMGDPEVAKEAVENLADEGGVSIITGGCSSPAVLSAAQVADEKALPFLITTASADKLSEMGLKFIFRLCLPVSEYTKPMLNVVSKLKGVKKACILREKSRYGHYVTKQIIRVCRRARILITDIIDYSSNNELNEAPYFPKLQEVRPDILFAISSGSEAVRILALTEAIDCKPKIVFCKGDPFLVAETYVEAQSRLANIYTSVPWHTNVPYKGAQRFAANFLEKYGIEPDYHAAQAYAAMQVIVDAISRALSPDPEDIRKALEQTGLVTIFGPVSFQSYGDKDRQNRPPMILLRWSGDELEPVPYSP